MSRPPAVAAATVALLVVTSLAPAPAVAATADSTGADGEVTGSAAGDRAATAGTDADFTVRAERPEIGPSDGRTNLTFSGIEPGTRVEITAPDDADVVPPSLLARALPGEPTSDGVRLRVTPNADGTTEPSTDSVTETGTTTDGASTADRPTATTAGNTADGATAAAGPGLDVVAFLAAVSLVVATLLVWRRR